MTENKSNKAIRLVKYLEQLSRLRSPAVLNYESYKKVVGFSDLFLEKYSYAPILFLDKNCANVLFEFQHHLMPTMPEIPLICKRWCEDENNPVKLKNTLETGEKLEDFPEVTSAFDDYLEKKYKPYKMAYSEWVKAQTIYSNFFDIHQELKRSSEDVELICGVGLLNWRFKDKKIIRHILTIGCELNFDPVNKKFTLTLDEQSKQIKVETEMLDESQLPLDLSSIINPFLEEIGNDIFEKDKTEKFLQQFVQLLDSEGQYSEDLSCKGIPTKAPIISYSPALILRKRSSALLTATLEHIRWNLLQQKDLPAGFKDLCEFTDGQNEGEISDSVDKTYHNDMIFFPKPSNAEQRKIAQKLAYGETVVIQGPPGTGKSHTIANLICHLLAQGKRILITAKTQRALNVLGNLLPQELRSLCVNLLGSGPEEQRILESNVGYIIRKHDDWDEESECLEKDKKTKVLAELKEEKVKLLRKIYDARESETKVFNIGNYYGTPARIAELIDKDKEKYSWFKDEINTKEKTDALKEKLHCFLQDTIYFNKTKIDFLNHFYDFSKVKLCLPDKFCTQVKCYEDVVGQLKDSKDNTVDPIFQKHNGKLENTLSFCEQILEKVYNSGEQWQEDVVRSIDEGDSEAWQKTLKEFESFSEEIQSETINKVDIKLPPDVDLAYLKEDVKNLNKKLDSRSCSLSDLKESFYIFEKVKINGHGLLPINDYEILKTLVKHYRLQEKVYEKTTLISFLHYLEKDNFSDLQKKVEIHQNLQNSVERNTDLLLNNRINIYPRNNVFEDIKNLVEYLKSGKGFGVPFFRPQIIKEHPYLLEIKYNGNKLRKLEDFNTCLQYISAYNEYVELQKYLGNEAKGISDIKAVLKNSKELLSDLDLIFQIYENLLPIKEILYECDLWISIFKPHASLYDVFGKYELTNNLKSVLAYLEHKEKLDKLSKAFPGYDLNLLNDDNLAKNVDKTYKRLQEILSLENHANTLKKAFGTFQFNLQTVRNLLANYRLGKSFVEKDALDKFFADLSKALLPYSENELIQELKNAIDSKNTEKYEVAYRKAIILQKELKADKAHFNNFEKDSTYLKEVVPETIAFLEQNPDKTYCEALIENFTEAYNWRLAKCWLENLLKQDDIPALSTRIKQIETEILETIKDLAVYYSWSNCFARLTDTHCKHMEAWRQSIKKIGKGTGKHANKHRMDAKYHLGFCKDAIPAWVMPLYRVFETITPESKMFDVVIVDEASQCGFEGIPLYYLAKKILVVGDDKQITPEAVGIPLDIVNRLKQEYLYDFEYASSFLPDNSLFEHAKLRSGKNMITLREHFRCMPEIIKFSNDLCYAETPLIPLRQYTSNRLVPLEHVFVENGYREGSGNFVVNPPEATAICNKIYDICRDEAYRDKSIGVVVLQGEQQAKLIQQKLLMTLPAEEIEGRGIICGNPYHFQGDERDVIILSMVAALNERNGTLSKPADERRFNVATSRARDQMILFHSVRRQDVSPNCLRARLLDFFEEIPVSKIASVDISDLEYHAYQDNRLQVKPPKPFDSWFEVDVGLELMRKKLNVFPQYKVAGKRIDFVIESHGYQLAIECDGDYWHGPEQYDQDMFRQRQLERCGWEFFRIRESAFYYDKNKCLEDLWAVLKCRNMI